MQQKVGSTPLYSTLNSKVNFCNTQHHAYHFCRCFDYLALFFFKDKNEEWPVDDGGEYRLSPRLTSERTWYM